MGRLENKVAIVTGGGKGIGRGIALTFAREGADVVVCGRTLSALESTVEEIKALGRRSSAITTNVGDKAQVQRLMRRTSEEFGKIDVLVNNAGITRHAPFLEMTEEDWDAVTDIDLKGVFICSQAVAGHMIERKYGKIVNILSVVALGVTDENMANYASAKAGAANLTKVTARVLGKYGINVNAIAPGTILTEMSSARRTPEEMEAFFEYRKKVAVLGRIGAVADIANLALFLASEESSFISGQIIACDGGRIDKM